jgi:hypothetical protein
MARHLSVESVIDKNKVSSATAWVALLQVDVIDPNTRLVEETLYIARNDENVVFGDQVYQAANFEFRITQRQGETPSVSLTAQDQTRYIQSRMEAMAGGVFSECRLLVVNTDRLDQAPELEESFQVTSSSTKDYIVTFQLGAENQLSIAFPHRRQSKDRCAWAFKGYGCPYVGPLTTCDYSLEGPNGCSMHFPGSRALPFKGLPGLVRLNI